MTSTLAKIDDYGFLSDCQSTALVDREGSVDWWCVPRFDSPSVFGRLLGADAGHWSLCPRAQFQSERQYVGDTLVLRTVFTTSAGEVALTDALGLELGARGHEIGLRSPHAAKHRGASRRCCDEHRAGPADGVRIDRSARRRRSARDRRPRWSSSPHQPEFCSSRWRTGRRAAGGSPTLGCGRPGTRAGSTSSKVMCWVALDRAVRLAPLLGDHAPVQRWEEARDRVRAAVLTKGWSERAVAYTGAFGSDELDASVLTLPLVRFLPADDERMWATIEAIERELGDVGLVRRWPEDPMGFLICTYWLVECLAMGGELARAEAWFARATSYANDLGRISEEADPDRRELLGNFPQAFSHVGLINAAWRLTETARCTPTTPKTSRGGDL